MTLRRAAVQLRKVSSIPVLLAALLLAASSSLLAQDRGRSRPSESGDAPSQRVAVPSESHSSGGSSSRSGWSGGIRTPEPRSPSGGDAAPANEQRGQGGGGRTAVPVGPGGGGQPHRQPPHNPSGGHGGHGGHHGGHGGYYGGGHYYPYYGWGYYPYWGYYGPYWGGFWAGYGFGWSYGAPYYGGGPYYRTPYYGGHGENGYGALDLDVSPGRTEVYVDGRYYGKVDAYDGFPQYLWLPRGTYDVVFFLDGYKTLARQISLNPGMVIDIGDRMEHGESIRPEDLVTRSHDRRDERLRYEDERREELERGEPGDDEEARMEEWRNRAREHQRERDAADEDGREDEMQSDARGRLVLNVDPEDASVYLDGRFVGTAEEIGGLRNGLAVDAGKHHLAIVRPGHRPEERYFEVGAGEEVELEVELALGSR